MPKFRNIRTGFVVDVPDRATTRTHRPKRQKQWADHLERLFRSKRWEQVPDSTPTGMPKSRPKRKKATATAPEPGSPLASLKVDDLKALAAERGVDLGEAKTKAQIVAVLDEADDSAGAGDGNQPPEE